MCFENVEDAKEAQEHANGMELDGCWIRDDFSITKILHSSTSGISMGRPTCGSSCHRDYCGRGRDYSQDYYRSDRGGGREGGGLTAAQSRDQIYRGQSSVP